MEIDVRYTLTEVTLLADGHGMAKFSVVVEGASEGIKQSFPFELQRLALFAEVESLIMSRPEFVNATRTLD